MANKENHKDNNPIIVNRYYHYLKNNRKYIVLEIKGKRLFEGGESVKVHLFTYKKDAESFCNKVTDLTKYFTYAFIANEGEEYDLTSFIDAEQLGI